MSLPFIQPAIKAVRQWADLAPSESPEPVNPIRQAKIPFDKKYPKLTSPIKLNDHQRFDLLPRLIFTSVGNNEVDLALSRTPADTNFTDVANFVSAVISAWREENPSDPDTSAARKLLEGSASLAAIDGKRESARLQAEQAEAEHRQFEQAYHEFRSIKARHEQLTGKVASLQGERLRLTQTNWDAKIKQILELELNPKPVTIHENIPSLLIQRDTMKLRLEVIDDLLGQCDQALKKLADDNKRLAKELDLPAHNI